MGTEKGGTTWLNTSQLVKEAFEKKWDVRKEEFTLTFLVKHYTF